MPFISLLSSGSSSRARRPSLKIISFIPSTALMGVRISCDIFARNSLLAVLDFSARNLAASRASRSRFFCSELTTRIMVTVKDTMIRDTTKSITAMILKGSDSPTCPMPAFNVLRIHNARKYPPIQDTTTTVIYIGLKIFISRFSGVFSIPASSSAYSFRKARGNSIKHMHTRRLA